MSVSVTHEDLKKCLSQESNEHISETFYKIKTLVSGRDSAPYEWLQTMCDNKRVAFVAIHEDMLMRRFSPSDQMHVLKNVQMEIPFVKEFEDFDSSLLMIQNNYFYDQAAAAAPHNLKGHVENINFNIGYLRTCMECTAVGVLWDTLYTSESTDKNMQTILHDQMVSARINATETTGIQQQLALALTRAYTTYFQVTATVDKKKAHSDAIHELLALLKKSFNAIYSALQAKCAQRQGVNTWYSSLIPRLISKQIRFYVTGAWALQKLVISLTSESTDRMDMFLQLAQLCNIHSLTDQSSQRATNIAAGLQKWQIASLFLQMFQEGLIFLRRLEGLSRNRGYAPWMHIDASKNFEDIFFIITNLPFLLMLPFLFSSFNENTRRQRPSRKLLLAGLICTNTFFCARQGLIFYDLRTHRNYSDDIISQIYYTISRQIENLTPAGILPGNRFFNPELFSDILHFPQNIPGLWVGRERRSTSSSDSILRSWNHLSANHNLVPATMRCIQSLSACGTVTSFTFFVVLNRLQEIAGELCDSVCPPRNHSEELQVFYNMQESIKSSRIAERQQEQRLQENTIENAYRGSNLNLFATTLGVAWYEILRWWTAPRELQQPRDEQTSQEQVQALFQGIEALWRYLSLDLLSSEPVGECLIIVDFQDNVSVMRKMLQPLVHIINLALIETNFLQQAATSLHVNNRALASRIVDRPDNAIVCKSFEIPNAEEWEKYALTESNRGQDPLLHRFAAQFKGFEQLPTLSDQGLKVAVKRYKELPLPQVENWGAHIWPLRDPTSGNHISLLHILPQLLEIRVRGSNQNANFANYLNQSRVSSKDCPQTELHTAYALGMLNMLSDNYVIAQLIQNTPTCQILMQVDRKLPYAGPAVFFAVHYAGHFRKPEELIKKALTYLAISRPLPIEEVYQDLINSGSTGNFEDFMADQTLNRMQRRNVSTVRQMYDIDILKGSDPFFQCKARALLDACAMRSPHPLPMLLQRWLLESDMSNPTEKQTMKTYYDLNPDILTACLIYDITLRMQQLLVGDDMMGETLTARTRKTLQFAREKLKVEKTSLQKILFFLAEYFVVYYPNIEIFSGDGIEREVNSIKDRLRQMAAANGTSGDPLKPVLAAGVLRKMEKPKSADIQVFFVEAQACLLQAVRLMGQMFEEVYATADYKSFIF